MRRTTVLLVSVVCLMVLGAVLIGRGVSAQSAPEAIYNPYPPGILPPDLVPEIDRVNREASLIEKEALSFKELEHVLIEKVEQLFRKML